MAEGLKLCKSVEKKLLKRNTKMRRAFYERFKKKVRKVVGRWGIASWGGVGQLINKVEVYDYIEYLCGRSETK